MKKAILIIIILLQGTKLFSALLFDPQLKWSSIKTEHFWIHYHQGIEEEAKKLSVIAEKVHKRLSPRIQWSPTLRTDVILVDNMYTANGFTTTYPFNRIQIFLSRPEMDGVLGNFDNWLEMVFTHEYTHVLNMDMVHWFPAALRFVLGRFPLLFPNEFVPIWMLEGNAVYHESNYSKYGRNNSTYTDMVIRTEVFNQSLKSISEASTFPRTWPVGNVPYLYGGLFVDYLENKYGLDTFAKIFIYNSNKFFPYQDNVFPYILPFWKSMSQWVYGEKFPSLWKEWQKYITIKYNNQISNIKKEQLTDYRKITKSGYITSLPRFSRSGKKIYYIRKTNYNKTALMSFSLETGEKNALCRVNDPNSISVAHGKNREKIYMSDAEFYRSLSVYNEVFVYDNSLKRLTSELKGSYIDISMDDGKICFIRQDKSKFSLIVSDLLFRNSDSIISNSDIQLAFTKFSPDARKIAFSIKDKNGNADIAVLDIAGKEIQRLTDDEYNDIHPAWHPDGNRIIFSSDRDGVYNLYEYNPNNKSIVKITNLVGGAFSPDVSPDGSSIVFAAYGKDGFDIAVMKYQDKVFLPVKADFNNLPVQYFNSSPDHIIDDDIKSNSYSSLNSIFPAFWLPIFGTSQLNDEDYQWVIGAATMGMDTLYKNIYLLDAYYYTKEKRLNVDFNYLFAYLYPDFILQYHDDTIFLADDEFPWDNENDLIIKRKMERSGVAGIALPFYYYQSYHILSLSYKYSESHTDLYFPGSGTANYKDTEAEIRAKYSYSNAAEYSYSISKEDGRDFFIISDFYRKQLGSDLSYSKVISEYAEYWPAIWKNNVIMTRVRGGASFGNPDYKSPYPLGRFQKGDTGTPATDEDEFGLRGYPYGSLFDNRIAVAAIEYRLPLLQKDFGLATFPLMFRDLWLTPFAEYGNVWRKETKIRDFKSSAGVELDLRITLGYYLNLQGYIGYAKGFNKYGEDQIYFAVSTLFEGALKNPYKWLDYL